jgi:hypothetical protein
MRWNPFAIRQVTRPRIASQVYSSRHNSSIALARNPFRFDGVIAADKQQLAVSPVED